MIKLENTEVMGLQDAIRGGKSDSIYGTYCCDIDDNKCFDSERFSIGQNDLNLMMRLHNSCTDE